MAAAAAAGRRAIQLGKNPLSSSWTKFRANGVPPTGSLDGTLRDASFGFSSSRSSSFRYNSFDFRPISQLVKSNGRRAFLVDTLALVRRLEGQGVPSKHAEAITAAITEVLNDSLENVAQSFVSKAEMQKVEMIQDSNLSKFKSEVQSSQARAAALA